MPGTANLTDAMIRKLEPPKTGMAIVWDTEVSGLGIRITAAGAKSFVLNYRNAEGRQRQMTIASFANDRSVTQARFKAKALKRQIEDGQDPLGEKQKVRAAPTVKMLAEYYIKHNLPRKRPSSQVTDKAYLNNHIIPMFGTRNVAGISHRDIVALHRKVKAPIQANRVLALATTMFNTAIKLEWIDRNPCKGVERNAEHPRQRYLTSDEISRLMTVLEQHPGQSANAIKLLLLSGARKMEVLGATWDQFDLANGVWIKQHATTKQKRVHRVPLGESALAILHDMRAEADQLVSSNKAKGRITKAEPFLFPGRLEPGQSRLYLDKFWALICRKAGIEGCRVHDLRHSFASILASSGVSLPIIGQLLGHSEPGTTARYSHLFDESLRKAANTVGKAVANAKPKVTPMRGTLTLRKPS
jgi:integrase